MASYMSDLRITIKNVQVMEKHQLNKSRRIKCKHCTLHSFLMGSNSCNIFSVSSTSAPFKFQVVHFNNNGYFFKCFFPPLKSGLPKGIHSVSTWGQQKNAEIHIHNTSLLLLLWSHRRRLKMILSSASDAHGRRTSSSKVLPRPRR